MTMELKLRILASLHAIALARASLHWTHQVDLDVVRVSISVLDAGRARNPVDPTKTASSKILTQELDFVCHPRFARATRMTFATTRTGPWLVIPTSVPNAARQVADVSRVRLALCLLPRAAILVVRIVFALKAILAVAKGLVRALFARLVVESRTCRIAQLWPTAHLESTRAKVALIRISMRAFPRRQACAAPTRVILPAPPLTAPLFSLSLFVSLSTKIRLWIRIRTALSIVACALTAQTVRRRFMILTPV